MKQPGSRPERERERSHGDLGRIRHLRGWWFEHNPYQIRRFGGRSSKRP
jgi:hypothetical protein